MKLSLRYFLIACLLLGAVGVPWGWKVHEKRKIEALEKQVSKACWDVIAVAGDRQNYFPVSPTRTPTGNAVIEAAQHRLDRLSGKLARLRTKQ